MIVITNLERSLHITASNPWFRPDFSMNGAQYLLASKLLSVTIYGIYISSSEFQDSSPAVPNNFDGKALASGTSEARYSRS